MATQSKRTGTKKSLTGPASLSKSHKSFQPVLPCGNKALQRKWDQTYYDEHRRLVRTAKPMVDTKAPIVRGHMTTKLKKKQLEKERNDLIDRDNLTLLKKMQDIMNGEGTVDNKYTYKHHSLNERARQLEMGRIARENRAMLKRLEDVEPMYKVTEWIDDWQRKEELTEMITAYPESVRGTDDFVRKSKVKSEEKDPEETRIEPEDSEVTKTKLEDLEEPKIESED